jgi:hypothetical protein
MSETKHISGTMQLNKTWRGLCQLQSAKLLTKKEEPFTDDELVKSWGLTTVEELCPRKQSYFKTSVFQRVQ